METSRCSAQSRRVGQTRSWQDSVVELNTARHLQNELWPGYMWNEIISVVELNTARHLYNQLWAGYMEI